jgi:hypothetical protein
MQTVKTAFMVLNTEDETVMGLYDSLEQIEQYVKGLKQFPPRVGGNYRVEKIVVTTETYPIGDVISIPGKTWTVESMAEEIIGNSDGCRDFDKPDELTQFSESEQAAIWKMVYEALDYCDHCGHLADATGLNIHESTDERLCDMCYDSAMEEELEELDDD